MMTMPDTKIKEALGSTAVNVVSNMTVLILVPLMGFVFTQIWTNGQDIAAIKVQLITEQRLDANLTALDTIQRSNAVDVASIKVQINEIENRIIAMQSDKNDAIKSLREELNNLRTKQRSGLDSEQDGAKGAGN
jgi:Mg2+ and Co2+ transporter CorA